MRSAHDPAFLPAVKEFMNRGFPPISRSWWEADHITPVCEKGGDDLPNIRTLCIECHKQATIDLSRKRTIERREKDLTPAF